MSSANAALSSAALRVLTVAIRPLTADEVARLKACEGADERLKLAAQEPQKVRSDRGLPTVLGTYILRNVAVAVAVGAIEGPLRGT